MKVKVVNFGCKVNSYESEVIKEKFKTNGYEVVEEELSDVVIVNTCSVTNVADNKCKKAIRRIKRENPNGILIVCGCTAENHRESLESLDIDILIGNKDKSKIVELLEEYLKSKKKYIKFYDNKRLEFEDMCISKFSDHTRAFVKIQDGCDNYCAFCVIPYMRGNVRFKDFNKCIDEVKELVSNGHKEIILTGIHTGSYGRGLDKNLVDLINEMSNIEYLERIRVSSIEITEITDEFLELLRTNEKVCNHLHIPLQSGSEEVLKLMNRKYDKKYFLDKISKIREVRPDISITTDVIVGFPGETEDMFNECVEFCKEVSFAKMHVFPYSVRTGTKAEKMDNHIDNGIKKQRSRDLCKVSDELEKGYLSKFVGEKLEIITEENVNGKTIGCTSNYIKVILDEEINNNEKVMVEVMSVGNGCVKGRKIDLKNKASIV